MGSDHNKTHETFTVAPATTVDDGDPPADEAEPTQAAPATDAAAFTGQAAALADPAGDAAGTAGDHGDEALTPIPAAIPVGDVNGVALLAGGSDLADATATLRAYDHADGPREVLTATVTPDAEQKLVEALALDEAQPKVAVTVDKDVDGRLPLDEHHQLAEQVETIAKSVNTHLKAGDGIPPHTVDNHAKLTVQLAELAGDEHRTADEQAMLAHYQQAADELGARLDPDFATGYHEGGKVGHLSPYTVAQTVAVTEMVPDPAADGPSGLATSARSASRLAAAVDHSGHASWDGTSRSSAGGGCEYAIDLGDGYTAVYRPHHPPDGAKPAAYSQRGQLEVHAPAGGGHAGELVDRLGQLNLVNRPLSAAEGEWAYLQANLTAQGLHDHPEVATALEHSRGLEDAVFHQLVSQRQHEAVGLDAGGLNRFTRQLLLDAEARSLPTKVAVLRDGIAKATGHGDGASLAASAGYEPTPTQAGGWLQWTRFDVAADLEKINTTFATKRLTHRPSSPQQLAHMFGKGGVLACTERRRLMGIKPGVGASEEADTSTGGATSVFLRVAGKQGTSKGPLLVWDDPGRLLARSDWYAYPGDHFGAINPDASQYHAGKLTRDPHTIAGFAGSNEVMFGQGIDLTGADAPSRVICGDASTRDQVRGLLADQGITHLGDRPVDDVVTT